MYLFNRHISLLRKIIHYGVLHTSYNAPRDVTLFVIGQNPIKLAYTDRLQLVGWLIFFFRARNLSVWDREINTPHVVIYAAYSLSQLLLDRNFVWSSYYSWIKEGDMLLVWLSCNNSSVVNRQTDPPNEVNKWSKTLRPTQFEVTYIS